MCYISLSKGFSYEGQPIFIFNDTDSLIWREGKSLCKQSSFILLTCIFFLTPRIVFFTPSTPLPVSQTHSLLFTLASPLLSFFYAFSPPCLCYSTLRISISSCTLFSLIHYECSMFLTSHSTLLSHFFCTFSISFLPPFPLFNFLLLSFNLFFF